MQDNTNNSYVLLTITFTFILNYYTILLYDLKRTSLSKRFDIVLLCQISFMTHI